MAWGKDHAVGETTGLGLLVSAFTLATHPCPRHAQSRWEVDQPESGTRVGGASAPASSPTAAPSQRPGVPTAPLSATRPADSGCPDAASETPPRSCSPRVWLCQSLGHVHARVSAVPGTWPAHRLNMLPAAQRWPARPPQDQLKPRGGVQAPAAQPTAPALLQEEVIVFLSDAVSPPRGTHPQFPCSLLLHLTLRPRTLQSRGPSSPRPHHVLPRQTRHWTSTSPSQAASFLPIVDKALGRASRGTVSRGTRGAWAARLGLPGFRQGGSTSSECFAPEATPTSKLHICCTCVHMCAPGKTPLESQECRLHSGLDLTSGEAQT